MRTQLGAGVVAGCLLVTRAASAQDITIASSAFGVMISGVKPSWSTGFGAVNGLGVGTPGAGLTLLTPAGGGGVLYATPYDIAVDATNGRRAGVRAFVSTPFAHPTVLSVFSCLASCTSAANYTALSTNAATPTDIIPSPGLSSPQTVTRYLALFVSNQNGPAAFSGADSATITFRVYRENSGTLEATYTVSLTNPLTNLQTALRLTLASAPGGRTISGSVSPSLAYGVVNGLGIAPATGLTSTAVSGGQVYATPYLLQPEFSSFASTSGTLTGHVSSDFGHPAQLSLQDSTNGAAFTALSKSSGVPTVLTTAATSGLSVTRYLGLFVSQANGASIFTGADTATLTFTLVVP